MTNTREERVATIAALVHGAMVHAATEFKGTPERWQNGNSIAEAYARCIAHDILESEPSPDVWEAKARELQDGLNYIRDLTQRTDISDGGKVIFIATKVHTLLPDPPKVTVEPQGDAR